MGFPAPATNRYWLAIIKSTGLFLKGLYDLQLDFHWYKFYSKVKDKSNFMSN